MTLPQHKINQTRYYPFLIICCSIHNRAAVAQGVEQLSTSVVKRFEEPVNLKSAVLDLPAFSSPSVVLCLVSVFASLSVYVSA